MRKILLLLAMLTWAPSAYAGGISVLVTDPDPQGTNVRATPSGKVIDVIPFAKKNSPDAVKERRVVTLNYKQGNWFNVSYGNGMSGFIHQSMLGACASATEDGNPGLLEKPSGNIDSFARIEDGTRVMPVDMTGDSQTPFLKVKILEGKLKGASGWLPEQALTSNPYSCLR